MLIASNQGRQLKRKIVGNNREAALTLEEVASALHESRIFTDREAVKSILNRNGGLDLEYHTLFSLLVKCGRYVISIREIESGKTYYAMHYCVPEPIEPNRFS